MIDIDILRDIKMKVPVIPTFEEKTDGKCITLVLKDGSVINYNNDGYLEEDSRFPSLEAFAKTIILSDNSLEEFKEMHWKSPKLLKIIQPVFKNVVTVWLGNM